jgi:hypothetical protein
VQTVTYRAGIEMNGHHGAGTEMNGHWEVGRSQRDTLHEHQAAQKLLARFNALPRSESPTRSLDTEEIPRSLADIAALLPAVPRRSESPTRNPPRLSPSQRVSTG